MPTSLSSVAGHTSIGTRDGVAPSAAEAMCATGKSLMPKRFDQKLTLQDATDLVALPLHRR